MKEITIREERHGDDYQITVNNHNPKGSMTYFATDNGCIADIVKEVVAEYNTLLEKYHKLRDMREDIDKDDLVEKIINDDNFEHCAQWYHQLEYNLSQIYRNLIKPLKDYYEKKDNTQKRRGW